MGSFLLSVFKYQTYGVSNSLQAVYKHSYNKYDNTVINLIFVIFNTPLLGIRIRTLRYP